MSIIFYILESHKISKGSTRIVGGEEVTQNSSAWHVGLLGLYFFATRDVRCGGTLISQRQVLSAAHCDDPMAILVGALNRRTFDESNVFLVAVNGIVRDPLHQFYSGGHYNHTHSSHNVSMYDFMVITMKVPVTISPTVLPAKLPTPENDDRQWDFKTLSASGWGSTLLEAPDAIKPVYDYPDKLHSVDLQYVTNHICKRRYRDFFNRADLHFDFSTDPMMCASVCSAVIVSKCFRDQGKGICTGDSGG